MWFDLFYVEDKVARLKNIDAFCSSCNSVQKMEITGELNGEDMVDKRWAKCKKCKQSMVIDLKVDVDSVDTSMEGIEAKDCTVYSPTKSYVLGEPIYHKNWDDFGKVVSKEILSNGKKSIAVEFQKSGLKKLIESLNN